MVPFYTLWKHQKTVTSENFSDVCRVHKKGTPGMNGLVNHKISFMASVTSCNKILNVCHLPYLKLPYCKDGRCTHLFNGSKFDFEYLPTMVLTGSKSNAYFPVKHHTEQFIVIIIIIIIIRCILKTIILMD